MSQFLLDITPQLHEEKEKKIRGSLNKATGLLFAIVVIPAVCWVLHYTQIIPALFKRELPPAVLASIGSIDQSINGATGFMIDSNHFLSTERAVKGDGVEATLGDPVKISFLAQESISQEPVEGKVSWISEPMSGTRLLLIQLPDDWPDSILVSNSALQDGKRLSAAGYQLDPETAAPKLGRKSFQLTVFEETLGSAEWGENAEPPTYEGAPVVDKIDDSYLAVGIVTQGTLVLKLPYEELREAGAGL